VSDSQAGVSAAAVPAKPLHVRVRNFKGTTMIAAASEARELSPSALVIWRSIDGSRTVGDIAGLLAAEYGIDQGTALADVAEFLAELGQAGFVSF